MERKEQKTIQGTAKYQGNQVVILDVLYNRYKNEAEFLIVYDYEGLWVTQSALTDVVWHID